MLLTKPTVRIISRDVTASNGELVRAFYAVIDIQGVIEVRFLGTKSIAEESVSDAVQVPLLANKPVRNYGETIIQTYKSVVSPFIQSLDLLVQQLARAPSTY